jgi:hypothetical protein
LCSEIAPEYCFRSIFHSWIRIQSLQVTILLSGGTIFLSEGTIFLSEGTNFLSGGTNFLSEGTNFLSGGTNFLSGGTNFLSGGTIFLSGGTNFLSGGTNFLSGGMICRDCPKNCPKSYFKKSQNISSCWGDSGRVAGSLLRKKSILNVFIGISPGRGIIYKAGQRPDNDDP